MRISDWSSDVSSSDLLERKVSAWMQNRRGPNRAGWAGLLQPAADGLKNILKEETRPGASSRVLFLAAPAMAFIPRSEERRVGPECVRKCRSRWSPSH